VAQGDRVLVVGVATGNKSGGFNPASVHGADIGSAFKVTESDIFHASVELLHSQFDRFTYVSAGAIPNVTTVVQSRAPCHFRLLIVRVSPFRFWRYNCEGICTATAAGDPTPTAARYSRIRCSGDPEERGVSA
jgi:hypothetical protein